MQRAEQLARLDAQRDWDVVVIGGGATGLGVALDAAARGFSTLLLEGHDFAKGTSSRSTKLLHGGVRYLAQGDIALVREALRERGRLSKNAPHLFKAQPFVIPAQKCLDAPYYTAGLRVYDLLAGHWGIGHTRRLSRAEAQSRLKGVREDKLKGGVCYFDGQFDDARLALNVAQTVAEQGGCVLNYCTVEGLLKDSAGKISGVRCRDVLGGGSYEVSAKCVVNATGVFANEVMAWDEPQHKPRILPSQGIHLVLDSDFLPGGDALMVPKTSDGRVLFAVPWHGKLVVGTTDTAVPQAAYEPKPLAEEIRFILDTAREYLRRAPTEADVRSVFVGLRPLVAPAAEQNSKEVSRSHKVEISTSGLLHIFGGKWTTFRQMAEDGIDAAVNAGLLPRVPCRTAALPLHGSFAGAQPFGSSPLSYYGSDEAAVRRLAEQDAALAEALHPSYPYLYAQVAWALEHEAAVTLEDVLARRIRLLFLDAAAAAECAPAVAAFMAQRLGWSAERTEREVAAFTGLAAQYRLPQPLSDRQAV